MKVERIHTSSYKLAAARAKGERIMTEASGGSSRAEMERRLIQRSFEEGTFRQRLLDDPRAAVGRKPGAPE